MVDVLVNETVCALALNVKLATVAGAVPIVAVAVAVQPELLVTVTV